MGGTLFCPSTDRCLDESTNPVPRTSHAGGRPANTQYTSQDREGGVSLYADFFLKKKLKLSTFANVIFLFLLFLGKKSQKR